MRFSRIGLLSLALSLPAAATLPGCIVVVHEDHDDSYVAMSGSKRIGVELETPGAALAAQTGLDRHHCSLVTRVLVGSPAEAAGFQRWDLIKMVEGQANGSYAALRAGVEARNIGDPIQITVLRAGQEIVLTPTVGTR